MKTVECGIKAFDVHELLCHFIAQRGGFYAAAGLDVRLVDTTFTPDDRLPVADYFQVACGAAAFSQNVPFKVFLAAVTKPMFWLYGAAGTDAVEQLAGKRIATYPAFAPPYWFNRISLRNHGIDPDTDVELKPARDDAIRLGLLREGTVDAALISSAISPIAIQRLGLNLLTMLGDDVIFVTSGIAVTRRIASADPELVEGLVKVYRKSLAVIHNLPAEVHSILVDVMGITQDVAEQTYELILPCYTQGGYVDMDTVRESMDILDEEMGKVSAIKVEEIYDFKLTEK